MAIVPWKQTEPMTEKNQLRVLCISPMIHWPYKPTSRGNFYSQCLTTSEFLFARLFAIRARFRRMRINVDVALREWNGYPGSVESLYRGIGHIPVDRPVIAGVDPRAADYVDGRIAEAVQFNGQRRIREDQRVAGNDLSEN